VQVACGKQLTHQLTRKCLLLAHGEVPVACEMMSGLDRTDWGLPSHAANSDKFRQHMVAGGCLAVLPCNAATKNAVALKSSAERQRLLPLTWLKAS
jgi:hypothetical protein